MQLLDLTIAGEFLVMAATLLMIKSRMLLPVEQRCSDAEEGTDEWIDPRLDLVRQLIEYKKFKDAAAHLSYREIEQSNLFARMSDAADAVPERPLGEVSVFDLINAFNSVLKRIATKSEDLREIFEENYTVSDKIDLIMKMMASGVALKFTELFAGAASRTEIVVTFLALLELIRLKQVRCEQEEPFAEIELHAV